MPSTRRAVLAALSVGLAGCASRSSTSGTSPPATTDPDSQETTPTATPPPFAVDTPEPGECAAVQPPISTVTATDGDWTAWEYPVYPESLTATDAASFARAYERSLRYNRYLATTDMAGVASLSVSASAVEVTEYEASYAVGVDGVLKSTPDDDLENSTATPPPYEDSPFGAWYYLADDGAPRNGFSGPLEADATPDLAEATTIVCD